MKKNDLRMIIDNCKTGNTLDELVTSYVMDGLSKPYSKNIQNAWLLVDHLKEKGILVKIERLFDCYRVSWAYDDIYADTAAEGLCKLAIIASLNL